MIISFEKEDLTSPMSDEELSMRMKDIERCRNIVSYCVMREALLLSVVSLAGILEFELNTHISHCSEVCKILYLGVDSRRSVAKSL